MCRAVRCSSSIPSYVNLTTFVLASHPRPVREAIERHRRKLDENTALYLREAEVALEEASRSALAGYLGVRPGEVALTDSTTMGTALVYARMKLAQGDEVVTTEHDFFATHESLRLREQLDGVDGPPHPPVRRAGGRVRGPDRLRGRRAHSARERAALALTWVHSSSGVKLPLRAIAARRRGCEPRPPRARAHPAVRRRRAWIRRRGRLAVRARHRRAVLRLPQVAVRPARHRIRLGDATGLAAPGPTIPSFTRASTSPGSRAGRPTRRPER